MRPLKSIGFLGLSPVLQSSACRISPLFSSQDSRSSCPALWVESRSFGRSQGSLSSFRWSSTSSTPSFTYRIGSSFSAKGRRLNTREDIHAFNITYSVSDNDIVTGRPGSGQDAFFVSRVGHSNNVAFGVADGVGGWSESGIDSAHFSHGLCRYMTAIARDAELSVGKRLGPRDLLQKGFDAVVKDTAIAGGGSTACVAVGEDDGHIEVANLGDSGFVQLRLNAVHYYSDPQTHAFNTPYQLSIVPPKVLARSRLFGSEPLSDFPRDASVTSHQVRDGDVLVFATDGVWDNLSSVELLRIVSRYMTGFQAWQSGDKGMTVSDGLDDLTQEGGVPKQYENSIQTLLAAAITGEAKAASQNSRRDGPFAKEVQKFYPHEDFHGGKVDDICVVVAIVVKNKS